MFGAVEIDKRYVWVSDDGKLAVAAYTSDYTWVFEECNFSYFVGWELLGEL